QWYADWADRTVGITPKYKAQILCSMHKRKRWCSLASGHRRRQDYLVTVTERRLGALQQSYIIAVYVYVYKAAGVTIIVENALPHAGILAAQQLERACH